MKQTLARLKTTRLSGVISACLLCVTGSNIAQAQTETIQIGYTQQVHDAPIMTIGEALKDKYKVEYIKFLRYADAEIALTKGDIQIASLGYLSAVTGASRGGEPKFVFVSGQSRGAINLVCRADVKIAAWADLKGHKFGVLPGGPAELFFDDALAKHGVSGADVEKVSFAVPGPPLLQALKDKAIDCMGVYEPFAASAVADGYGYYPPIDLGDNSFYGINGAVAVSRDYLASHRDAVQAAVDAIVKTAVTYPTDEKKWISTVVAITGFPAKTVEIGIHHVILDSNLYLARDGILAKAAANLGMIKKAPGEEALAAYFDYAFLRKATGKSEAELGKTQ